MGPVRRRPSALVKAGALLTAGALLAGGCAWEGSILRLTAPPAAQATSRVPPSRLPQAPRTIGPTRVFECPPGVERDIKRLEGAFNLHWTNRDAENLALLWADQGDMVHPDGHIEKTRRSIYQHRYEQFNAPEFKGARHSLAFGIIRCINAAMSRTPPEPRCRQVRGPPRWSCSGPVTTGRSRRIAIT